MEEKKIKRRQAEQETKVKIGEALKPVYKEDTLSGFQFRKEIVPVVFKEDEFKFDKLRRISRANVILNRVLSEGLDKDFKLIEFEGDRSEAASEDSLQN